jgi:hypothetical protein
MTFTTIPSESTLDHTGTCYISRPHQCVYVSGHLATSLANGHLCHPLGFLRVKEFPTLDVSGDSRHTQIFDDARVAMASFRDLIPNKEGLSIEYLECNMS